MWLCVPARGNNEARKALRKADRTVGAVVGLIELVPSGGISAEQSIVAQLTGIGLAVPAVG